MTSIAGTLAPGLTSKLNLVADVVLLLGALCVSAVMTGQSVPGSLSQLGGTAFAAVCVWIITATALRYYDPWAPREALDDAALGSVTVLAVTTVLALVYFFVPDRIVLPSIAYFLLVFWPAVVALRLTLFRAMSQQEEPLDEVLILGTGPLGRATGDDLQKKGSRRKVVGYLRFPDEPEVASVRQAQVYGRSDELEQTLHKVPVGEIYIAGNLLKQGEAMQAAIKVCERLGVPFALPAYSFRLDRARPVANSAIQDGYLHYLNVVLKPNQLALKRLFDIVASAAALWVLMPLLGGVALIIKFTSRGPIFFKQERVGVHGRHFNMLKFRSMVTNAEELKAKLAAQNEQTGPVFKMKNDPRVTRIGRFIRKFSIDELPQLVNVLRGDMSIVGPRPPVPQEVAKYEPWQRRRLSVRPGLTCIWQVSGRNQISFQEWMYLDMQYIDHWSLRQDFDLILKTVPVVITGRGAS